MSLHSGKLKLNYSKLSKKSPDPKLNFERSSMQYLSSSSLSQPTETFCPRIRLFSSTPALREKKWGRNAFVRSFIQRTARDCAMNALRRSRVGSPSSTNDEFAAGTASFVGS